LQRDVLDAEMFVQDVPQGVKRPVPAGEVAHDDMRGKGNAAAGQGPDVQVMHRQDAFLARDFDAHGIQRKLQRHALHQRVHGLP